MPTLQKRKKPNIVLPSTKFQNLFPAISVPKDSDIIGELYCLINNVLPNVKTGDLVDVRLSTHQRALISLGLLAKWPLNFHLVRTFGDLLIKFVKIPIRLEDIVLMNRRWNVNTDRERKAGPLEILPNALTKELEFIKNCSDYNSDRIFPLFDSMIIVVLKK